MADQNTPPGSRTGRPFIPPFRKPTAPGAGEVSEGRQVTQERPQPRPFVPPGAARPLTPPARPAAPASFEPPAPPSPPSPPVVPRPMSPVDATAIFDDAARPSPTGGAADDVHTAHREGELDGLAVEHAISETLGQGPAVDTGPSFELERASEESPDALPALPVALEEALPVPHGEPPMGEFDEPPSGGPELPLLMPDYGADLAAGDPVRSPPWMSPSEAIAAVEEALVAEGRAAADEHASDARGEEMPSSEEPLPWLAPPPDEPAARRDEAEASRETGGGSSVDATAYDAVLTRRITPPGGPTTVNGPGDVHGIVGANLAVAEALERVARRVRSGELRVPAVEEAAGEAGSLAAALAVLLGVRS